MNPRSLFWTFAGVFLLVLAAATVAQVVVSIAVLRPIAEQRAREQAGSRLDFMAREVAAQPDPLDPPQAAEVLRAHRLADRRVFLVYLTAEGVLVPDRPVRPEMHHRLMRSLIVAGIADSSRVAWEGRMPSRRFDGAGEGPPPYAGGPFGEPPVDEPPGRDSRHGPPRPGGPGGPPPDDPSGAGPAALRMLAHVPVRSGGAHFGDLAAIGPGLPSNPWSLPESRALMIFLPVAVLAAGGAGLLMVRILVRRLESLQQAATRVIDGDLLARVETTGGDEIGRLEQTFNRMTERLAAARDALERTDRQRRRLLADITHELATPLTSIKGYVETLLDPAVPKSAEEHSGYLRDVLDEAQRLDLLTSDLFDLARLESGASPLRKVRLDWSALARNTSRRLAPRFQEMQLDLRWNGGTEEHWVDADGRRLEQVVENLLVNAVRYVPSGGVVEIDFARVRTPDGDRHRMTVADDGPGIPPADLPHVFERFYRAESVRTLGGTGLGLAIVREIAVQHGGDVRVEARSPRGVAFVVELKVAGDP